MSMNDWWKEQHDLQLREPAFWRIWVQKHFRSADLIWHAYAAACSKFMADPEAYDMDPDRPLNDDRDLSTIAFFHLAIALELVVKGHLVRGDPQIVEKNDFYTHDLESLCARIHMQLSESEMYLVKQLRHLVEWHGRYPTPRHKNPNAWERVPDAEGRDNMPGRIAPDDYQRVRKLIEKVDQHAQQNWVPSSRTINE